SEIAQHMIVVGAAAPDGTRARFSNHGKERVDLLAPGCRIQFTGPSGESDLLNGTSFAAPLVTFAAALVRGLGVPGPIGVKERIVASGDYDPSLEDTVIYSARLNII